MPGRYTLDLPLLRISVRAGQLDGVYRALWVTVFVILAVL